MANEEPDYTADVQELERLPPFRFVNELQGMNAKYVRGLASHLGISLRYDSGERRSKSLLAACIFEHFRQKVWQRSSDAVVKPRAVANAGGLGGG
jgi:hypothetical protein